MRRRRGGDDKACRRNERGSDRTRRLGGRQKEIIKVDLK